MVGADDQTDQKQEDETPAPQEGLTMIEECDEESLEESRRKDLQTIPEARESQSARPAGEAKDPTVDSRGSPKVESTGPDKNSLGTSPVIREQPSTIYRIPSELSNSRRNSDAVIASPTSQDFNQPEGNHPSSPRGQFS